jgi:thioredoxin 1
MRHDEPALHIPQCVFAFPYEDGATAAGGMAGVREAFPSERIRCAVPAERNDVAIITLTDALFDETVNGSEVPVLVDFWAEWCGPCKMITPVLEEIAKEQTGKITIVKLNVDDNPDTARRYEVMSIPTLMLFHNGSLEKRLVGARSKSQLMAEIAQFIG